MIKTIEIDLPAYWASALINKDYCNCNPSDDIEAHNWATFNPKYNILSCNDTSFIGRYNGIICDMLTYTVEVME